MKEAVSEMHKKSGVSIRRAATAFDVPPSTVGRWLKTPYSAVKARPQRKCAVSNDPEIVAFVRSVCEEDRHRTFGHRRIHAILTRTYELIINRKTVLRIMQNEGLVQPKVWRRTYRPKRIEKMRPQKPNQGWQIDMTSFKLTTMTTLFLVVVIDCYSRKIVGWTLDSRSRKTEWIAALRLALDAEGLDDKEACKELTLRSDNGSQPCSKLFVEYLAKRGVKGQYIGYDAPDDNAFVERVIRTIKEEEIWPNSYDTLLEAHKSVGDYLEYYNSERLHSSLNYKTPNEVAAMKNTLIAA